VGSRFPNRFSLDGVVCVFGVLPSGLRSSAAIFPHFARVTATALRASGLTKALIAYMDDLSISVQDTSLDLLGCYLGTAALNIGVTTRRQAEMLDCGAVRTWRRFVHDCRWLNDFLIRKAF